jgi:predicted ATPase/DNA-binding CsgD family transcriptional regulator
MVSQTQAWLPHSDGLSKRAVEILRLLAEGLSDRDIAERLVMTIGTVKWYNRQIYRTLGVGSRTQAIASARERGLLEEPGTGDLADSLLSPWVRPSLPAPTTPFVGRRREVGQVQDLLGAFRLLSLTGVGGIGKTRLALRLAEEVGGAFPDGVYFVDLAPLSDPAQVVNAIAATLRVQESTAEPLLETLKRALAPQRMLLLLDNFEHVIAAAPMVSELLAACPQLKALVTSRESLHLHGEQEFPVATLSLPGPEAGSVAALAASEAGTLFLQRAQMTQPDFAVSAETAPTIAQICARLDGLPLAIELAAARIKVLSPLALLARLTSPLDTLTGGPRDLPNRQQTLYNTIAWSYHLLTDSEQRLFARLAIFRGGSSLEAIEAVCGEDLSIVVLDGLESLVNKNLIQRRALPGGELRFAMLETLHEYAQERLAASGEAATLARRHAAYFVDLAEQAEPELRQAQQWRWFRRLEADHGNLRTALGWSLDDAAGDLALGVRLAGALGLYWTAYGFYAEGYQWTDRLLDQLDATPTRYHAKLLITAGRMVLQRDDLGTAHRYFEQALQISRALDDPVNIAWALAYKSCSMMRETDAAITVAEEGLALFRELDHQPGIAQTLNILGELARVGGDDTRARQAYEACLEVSQRTGETRRICCVFGGLTFLAQHAGDYEQARDLAEEGLQIALAMNNDLDIVERLAQLAGALGMLGQPEWAARLLGAWEAALEHMVATPEPVDKAEHDRNIAAVRAQLDATTFTTAWALGRAMSLEQAVALALERTDALDPLESGAHR